MKKNLYCIVDTVNKEWGPIVVMNNDEAAERMFRSEVDKIPSNVLVSYELYRVGSYNPDFNIQKDVLTPICSDTFATFIISGQNILNEDIKEILEDES